MAENGSTAMDGLSAAGGTAGIGRAPGGRRGLVAVPSPRPDRPLDVLELDFAGIGEGDADLAADLGMDDVRDENAAMRRLAFEAGRDVDAVAENVVALDDDVAEIDADAELDGRLGREVALAHRPLDGDGAFDRIDDAAEFDQRAVAHHLDDAAVPRGDGRVERLAPDLPERGDRAGLVGAHHRGIAGNVGGEDGGEPAGNRNVAHADLMGGAACRHVATCPIARIDDTAALQFAHDPIRKSISL